MKKYWKNTGFYIILVTTVVLITMFLYKDPAIVTKNFSDLYNDIEAGKVSGLVLEGQKATVEYKDNKIAEVSIPSVEVFMLYSDLKLKELMGKNDIKISTPQMQNQTWWMAMIPYLVLTAILVVLFIFFQQTQGGGGSRVMSFGKSRAKLVTDQKKKVTFADVAGADEEKEDLEEIVGFLKSPQKYTEIGARIPKGVLLVGPPGTGKTLLAKAVSGEADVPFYSISGSDFVEMFVGVGAARVRDLFEQAKKSAPSVVFIDEIDAVGRHRGAGLGGGHDEREQTLNQLLVEMDGFGVNEGVIIIAATNRPDILDPALLRPGRFDRQIVVNYPDVKGREEILKVHARNKPLAGEVNLGNVAKTTAGFTGADLENLLNESALLSARHGKKEIDNEEIQQALMKVVMGTEKKSSVMSEKEKKLTAVHEAGHALISRLMPTQDPVHEISIIPRGRAGGYTMNIPQEDKKYSTKNEMTESIVVLLGGRTAEKMVLDDISTGASNDIERASDLARKMVTRYGMSDVLGPISFGSTHDEVFIGREWNQTRNYGEGVAAEIDAEVRNIIEHAYQKCMQLLEENRMKLDELTEALLSFEKIDGPTFEKIFVGQAVVPENN